MPHKDPEKQKEYDRQRYLKNKEEIKQRSAEFYEKNKEEKKEYQRKYQQENKEKIREAARQYYQTEKGKRSAKISAWKLRGLVAEDYDAIYDRYINTHKCDCCQIFITSGYGSRVMDHCHKTGKFRNVLCHNCNIMRFHLDNNYIAYVKLMAM